MSKITWRQTRMSIFGVSEFLTKNNLHPGYFHIIQDGIMVELIYMILPDALEGQHKNNE